MEDYSRCTTKKEHVPLHNYISNVHNRDTLHSKCKKHCLGALMKPDKDDTQTTATYILQEATTFMDLYYRHLGLNGTEGHAARLKSVQDSISKTGVYDLSRDELVFGTKSAWRNAPRCIGRQQWNNLQVFDCRTINSTTEMFEAICKHLKYATNKGKIRSTITVFPVRRNCTGENDFRVWNPQLIKYAGYITAQGGVIGDTGSVEFTKICESLGWKGERGMFDVLPLVLSANGNDPDLFEIPRDLVLQVSISHPTYDWFGELGLRWYAVPAVSDMVFECGGLTFPAVPFNGWYMVTEIGARDICDPQRYNMLEPIAKRMGLDTSDNSSFWKDKALLETTLAVNHSFQAAGVTIWDHHTASDSFIKHFQQEEKVRGGCPADWVWIVPPLSGSATKVFHQEMVNYQLKPSLDYQLSADKTHEWKDPQLRMKFKTRRLITLKEATVFIMCAKYLTMKALAKRERVCVLFGTETGRSEEFALKLAELCRNLFYVEVYSMDQYNITKLDRENIVLIVTSTFGNGNPPENAKTFARQLSSLAKYDQKDGTGTIIASGEEINANVIRKSFNHIRFAVFGLGSRAYHTFCQFAHDVHRNLIEIGAQKLRDVGEGDELYKQSESFRTWTHGVIKDICEASSTYDQTILLKSLNGIKKDLEWNPTEYRTVKSRHPQPSIAKSLSTIHQKTITPYRLRSKQELQSSSSSRSTLHIRLESCNETGLSYDPGDHIVVFPSNDDTLVNKIMYRIAKQDSNVDDVIEVQQKDGDHTWKRHTRLPPCSVRTALRHFVDISAPPTQELLAVFAAMTSDLAEQHILRRLSTEYDLYKETLKALGNPSTTDILDVFTNVIVTAELILTQFPIIKPRYYSVSSCPLTHINEIHLTVALQQHSHSGHNYGLKNIENSRKHRYGLCSGWFRKMNTTDVVPLAVKRSEEFHLPYDSASPIILVAAGAGIAPFRGFLQRQQTRANLVNEKRLPTFSLFYGCRHPSIDYIYEDELVTMLQSGVLENVAVAYSQTHTGLKRYVQKELREQSLTVYRKLMEEQGHVYVCGGTNMARGVRQTILDVIQIHGRTTATRAEEIIQSLKEEDPIANTLSDWSGIGVGDACLPISELKSVLSLYSYNMHFCYTPPLDFDAASLNLYGGGRSVPRGYIWSNTLKIVLRCSYTEFHAYVILLLRTHKLSWKTTAAVVWETRRARLIYCPIACHEQNIRFYILRKIILRFK